MSEPVDGTDLIPLGSLKRYLEAAGWHRRTLPNGTNLFSSAEDEDIEIVLPATSQSRDTPERILDAVETLRALEGRTVDEVAAAIRSVSYDLVRTRLPDSAIRHDTIRLDVAKEFVRRMTQVLANSAHAELHNGPYAERLSTTATDYANECRFGHTFRGSFGFTVESQVGPKSVEIGKVEPTAPLPRRAVIGSSEAWPSCRMPLSTESPGRSSTGTRAV
jgi:hypothetical protein